VHTGRNPGMLGISVACSMVMATVLIAGSASVRVHDRQDAQPPRTLQPELSLPLKNDVSPRLDSIRPIEPVVRDVNRVRINKVLPGRVGSTRREAPNWTDPVAQTWHGRVSMPAPIVNFDGVNNTFGVYPPDTQGAVGPNHYVQWVNLGFAIYNKSGTKVYPAGAGFAAGNTLWAGFGAPCQGTNDGDPITLYDKQAGRWLMSQFALPNYPNGPFYQCLAISQTGDPTGAWNRYSYSVFGNKMNDYPHFGIWPDGYYMSVNQFASGSGNWAGQGVVAFERDKMLTGLAARALYFDLYARDPNLGGMLPSDLDGPTLPPAGSPNYFLQIDDDAWGYSPDQLQYFKFHVDWTNVANSTFTGPTVINLTTLGLGFDSNMCGYARNCIPQPDTSARVDAIADRVMYRLAYRNFGNHQSLVVNHTVDVNNTNRAGIRWYEIRNPNGTPTVFQAGTYSPDTNHRWMGSVAMDAFGNMALGFSVSSASMYPAIRYVGRLATDPPNTLPQAEVTLMDGTGAQTGVDGRWGDYSMMSVDPTDDCTFWYTQEYVETTGFATWRTRIGSFKFPLCGATLVFADDPLSAGATKVKGLHIVELRQAVEALRARYGLGTVAWTDTAPVTGVTPVKAIHVTELRSALNAVYTAAGRIAPNYTHPTITGGATVITAVDVTELRAAIVAIW
jgi:hypothetical protein